jgi:allantoate deiminase
MGGVAETVMERIEALGGISDEPARLTRTYGSPAMRRANELVASWMREAGMDTREDAIGNIIGHYPAKNQTPTFPTEKIFLLGSHLDTVRDAGKFDGPLGVLVAIACIERLNQSSIRLPFAIEVIGFADEEGVRFQSAFLGSKALTGALTREDLERRDAAGITPAEAIRDFGGNPDALGTARMDPKRLLGYAEVHIEQGPVLEQKNLTLGVVTAISGQTRARIRFIGRAGHAGTVPMHMREDALCAASEFVLAVEACGKGAEGLVATVGEIAVLPGASNVIPGEVSLSLDVRHADDTVRTAACAKLRHAAKEIVKTRSVEVEWQDVHELRSVACSPLFTDLLNGAVKNHQGKSFLLPSGAGHDAAAIAAITPVAMLFVRCKGGISHHPDESAAVQDIRAAIDVVADFLQLVQPG